MSPRTIAQLDAGLDIIRQTPKDRGTLVWITRRPAVDQRETLEVGTFEAGRGLVGDSWGARAAPNPDCQVTIMSARAIARIEPDQDRWALAGDQLYVDFDISDDNLPPGSRLHIGTAVLEVTAKPHTDCKKFRDRFGADALRWANSPEDRRLRLRGLNARVVQSGVVGRGDAVTRQ